MPNSNTTNSYEDLSLSGFINEIENVSSGPHPRKFCFILGAGASKTSNIKSGQELVDIWDKELLERNPTEYQKWKCESTITDDNKYSYYSHYYEKRFSRHPSDGYNYIEKLMEHAKPSVGYVMLADLLSRTSHNVVITTNFDHLIEDAVNYYVQEMPLVIGHESLAGYITKSLQRPTIIKIHRDLLFNPANKIGEVETLHENWEKGLNTVFSEYHPIFIGYAGNDNSLMDYLIDNSKHFADETWKCPYWMLYKNDKLDGKVLKFLVNSKGYCVKHDGFDEVLYLMSVALNYKMPTEETFLEDAKRRFRSLSDSIDEFTDKYENDRQSSLTINTSNVESAITVDIQQAVHQITEQTELQKLFRLATILHNDGKYDEALYEKQKLVNLAPNNARYHDSLWYTLDNLERYEEALIEAQKAVDLEPDNARYHASLWYTLDNLERYEEALIEAQKAVDLEPEDARYHDSLGDTLDDLERYEEALIERQKAVDLEPDDARYHDSFGDTLDHLERYEEALIERQKAVDLEPDDALYHANLGNTLDHLE
jgi:Flp pilus assembly protein TadD